MKCERHVYPRARSIACDKKAEFLLIVAEDRAHLCATHLIVELRTAVKMWEGVMVVSAVP